MIRLCIIQTPGPDRKAMVDALQGEADLKITDCFESISEALLRQGDAQYDVLLVHCNFENNQALELVRELTGDEKQVKVLVTGLESTEEAILYCMEEGADGYVCACEGWAEMVKKIHAVYDDEFWLPPDLASALMARIAELKQLVLELDGGSEVDRSENYGELTQRELEVLRLLSQDLSNQEIAEALTIELGTVKNHVHNLLRKLDVTSRKQAAQLARQILGEQVLEAETPAIQLAPVVGWRTPTPQFA